MLKITIALDFVHFFFSSHLIMYSSWLSISIIWGQTNPSLQLNGARKKIAFLVNSPLRGGGPTPNPLNNAS